MTYSLVEKQPSLSPQSSQDKLTFTIPTDLKKQLKQVAAIKRTTMGDLICQAIIPIVQMELGQ